MSALPTSQPGWTDADWDALLDQIAGRQVIPIIGQDLLWLTLDGVEATLATHVARRLAGRLDVAPGESVHAVVCRYLKKEGCQYGQVYRHVHEILRDPALPVPPALAQLAEITDFTLYISTTVDPLLERALDAARFGGERRTRRIVFTPKKRAGLPDGFDAIEEPTVFYALGQAVPEKGAALPGSFVVSEEDLVEFLHALRASEGNDDLDRLVQAFSDNYLLLLGGGFSDWVTRFFLRFTRKERLYRPGDPMGEYFAETCGEGSGLVLFLQHFRQQSKLFCEPGPTAAPVRFVAELHRRWLARNGPSHAPAASVATASAAIPREMPAGAIFLSYAREDLAAVLRFKALLDAAGVPAWLDMEQIKLTHVWEPRIRDNIARCGFFLPFVSANTEAKLEGYFRTEWKIACQRASTFHGTDRTFLLPASIDGLDPKNARQVPTEFREAQWTTLPDPDFVRRLQQLFLPA